MDIIATELEGLWWVRSGVTDVHTSKVDSKTCVVLAQVPSFSIMLVKSSSRTSLAMACLTYR